MTTDNKRRVREEVERNGWTIIWIGAEMPCKFLDEVVNLLYEDMDGQPCICQAAYTYDKKSFQHLPYFKRVTDGSHMVNCIAWKKLAEAHDG